MSRFIALCVAILVVAMSAACAKKPDPIADTEAAFLEFLDAANAVGGLTRAQRERLHRLISQQNYTYQQILEFAKAIKAGQL